MYIALANAATKNPKLSFLELGHGHGDNFRLIPLTDKSTVDTCITEEVPGYYGMNTETFFKYHCDRKYNVIYIDADHKMPHPLLDYNNAVNHISDNGVIIIHDLFPKEEDIGACENGYVLLWYLLKNGCNVLTDGSHMNYGITAIFPPFKQIPERSVKNIIYKDFARKVMNKKYNFLIPLEEWNLKIEEYIANIQTNQYHD